LHPIDWKMRVLSKLALVVLALALGLVAERVAAQTELNIADNLGKRFHISFGKNYE